MQVASIYAEYLQQLFPSFTAIREKKNGKKTPPTYLHKQMLRTVHSTDKRWESSAVNTRYVAADIVAMNSPLPIKSRQPISFSDGRLPKIGMLRQLKESDIDEIDTLIERHAPLAEVLNRLYDDVDFCSVGIDEKNEYNFLYGFSHGIVVSEDLNNVGAGVRVNFGYFESNTFGVIEEGHISREDIERLLDKADADGNAPGYISLSEATYKKLRRERWARELVASSDKIAYTAETTLPVPSRKAFNEAFAEEFGDIEFNIVNRKVDMEKNGRAKSYKPFANDRLIFHTAMQVGALVWGDLAEKNHPVPGVEYQLIDQYKLISAFGETNPMSQFTASQALVLPVIENVDEIYILDSTIHQPLDDDDRDQGGTDSVITVFGNKYDKSDVIAQANEFGLGLTLAKTDAEVIEAINTLNQKRQLSLKKALETKCVYYPKLDKETLSFAAAGATQTVNVKTNATGEVTATSEDEWLTVTIANGVVSVVAAANTGESAAKRTGSVVVTAGEKSSEIAVSQEAPAAA